MLDTNALYDIKGDALSWLGTARYTLMLFNQRSCGQRLGQAFFNALESSDQNKLCATEADPFNSDEWEDIKIAIDYLLEH